MDKQNREINQETIRDLVLRAAQGEKEAFQQLYIATRKQAYFTSLSITKNEADAQDILQESYLKAYQSLGQLENPALFPAWLNRIVANKAKNYISRIKPDSFADYEDGGAVNWQEETDPLFIPDERLDRKEAKALVIGLVSELPEDQRLVVLMRYYHDMEVAEVAKTLEVPVGTVKSRLSRARQKLAATLDSAQQKGLKLYSALPMPFLAYFIKLIGFEESSADRLPPLVLGTAAGGTAAVSSATRRAAKKAADTFQSASVPLKAAAGAATVLAIAGAVIGALAFSNSRKALPTAHASPDSAAVQATAPTTAIHNETATAVAGRSATLPSNTTQTEAPPVTQSGASEATKTQRQAASSALAATVSNAVRATTPKSQSSAEKTTKAPVRFSVPTAAAPVPFPTWPKQTSKSTSSSTTEPTNNTIIITTTKPTPKPQPIVSFEFDTGRRMIMQYTGTATEVAVPAEIDGTPVLHLAPNAFFGSNVTRVEIAQGVDCIQSQTFGNCGALRELVIPPSVHFIMADAFRGCRDDLVIFCWEDTPAHTFALSQGMCFEFTE